VARRMNDQVASVRMACSQLEKLQFAMREMIAAARQGINDYFAQMHEKIERRRKGLLADLDNIALRKAEPVEGLINSLPEAIRRVQEAAQACSAAVHEYDDLELLHRKRQMLEMAASSEFRPPKVMLDDIRGDVLFKGDDRFLFLDECSRLERPGNADIDRVVGLLSTLLDTSTSQPSSGTTPMVAPGATSQWESFADPVPCSPSSVLGVPAAATSSTRRSPADEGTTGAGYTTRSSWRPDAGGLSTNTEGWRTTSQNGSSYPSRFGADGSRSVAWAPARPGSALSLRSEDTADFGVPAPTTPDVAPSSALGMQRSGRPYLRFDPQYSQTEVLQLATNGRSVCRVVPMANTAFVITKSLLQPGERVDFLLEEFNVFLEGSGWIGATPMRSMSLVAESSIYLDLHRGTIVREEQAVQRVFATDVDQTFDSKQGRAGDGGLEVRTGDVLSIVLTADRSLIFYLNTRQISSPIVNAPDLLYPFVNLTGKLVRVSLR